MRLGPLYQSASWSQSDSPVGQGFGGLRTARSNNGPNILLPLSSLKYLRYSRSLTPFMIGFVLVL
jgi:hypothetical protein